MDMWGEAQSIQWVLEMFDVLFGSHQTAKSLHDQGVKISNLHLKLHDLEPNWCCVLMASRLGEQLRGRHEPEVRLYWVKHCRDH